MCVHTCTPTSICVFIPVPHYHMCVFIPVPPLPYVCVHTCTPTSLCVSIPVPHYHMCVHTCTPTTICVSIPVPPLPYVCVHTCTCTPTSICVSKPVPPKPYVCVHTCTPTSICVSIPLLPIRRPALTYLCLGILRRLTLGSSCRFLGSGTRHSRQHFLVHVAPQLLTLAPHSKRANIVQSPNTSKLNLATSIILNIKVTDKSNFFSIDRNFESTFP